MSEHSSEDKQDTEATTGDDDVTISMVQTTAGLVEEYLADFGDSFSRVDQGTYFAKRGSTLVGIHVVGWKDDALVHISANVVKNAELKAELLDLLLRENFRSSFGAFGISPEGTINFRHTLLGSTLEKEQLIPAVVAVARNADDWDDRIIDLAGGETAVETLRKRGSQGDSESADESDEGAAKG